MKTALWILTVLGSLIGGLTLLVGLLAAQSSPQEASVSAMAIAFAVIPYCLARAVSELGKG